MGSQSPVPHLRESAQEGIVGRSVPWVLSKDLRGHSCPGVCLSQEPEGHLETGARVIFSAPSLHPVSKRGMENCVPGGCDPANTQATFLGSEGEFPFCGGRGLVDPDAGCLSVCLSVLWFRLTPAVIYKHVWNWRHPWPWCPGKGRLCLH